MRKSLSPWPNSGKSSPTTSDRQRGTAVTYTSSVAPVDRLSEVLTDRAAFIAAAHTISQKTAKKDCGCGCEGAGDCVPVKVAHRRPVAIPGLVHSSEGSLEAKAFAHVLHIGEHPESVPTGTETALAIGLKVGSFGSHNRLVQVAQGVGSYLTPGDMSRLRSPIRSGLYRALTPGGGDDNRIGGVRNLVRRCPPGYEHGGRFANAGFSNCGSLIFDIADGPDGLIGSVAGAVRQTVGGTAVSNVVMRGVGAGAYGESPIQSRVPAVGKPDKGRVASAVEEAVAAASSSDKGFMRFIRKDGISIKPVATVDKLLGQRNHPEMVGSVLVTSANKPEGIGGNEVRLLGNGLSAITYALPGGHTMTLRPKQNITPRKASALARELATIRSEGDEHGRALRLLAERNAAFLTFAAEFKNVEGANEMIVMERNGMRRTVQKWAFLTWYASNSPGRVKTSSPWRLIDDKA